MPLRPTLVFFLLLAPACAQTVHLHGTVTDTTTHQPIPRALVTNDSHSIATLTDREGRFTVDLDPSPNTAMVELYAERPGYLSNPEGFSVQLAAPPDIVLSLTPAATLTGRVLLDGPFEPANISVELLHRASNEQGHLAWPSFGQTATNSRGEFRFPLLEPGEYTVHTLNFFPSELPPQPDLPTQNYPPLFNGDSPTLATATPLHLRAGQTQQVELHLHAVTAYPVTIPIRTPIASLNITIGNSLSGLVDTLAWFATAKAVRGFLPRGEYTVHLAQYGDGSSVFGTLELNVEAAPLTVPAVTLAPGASIPVHVHTQFGQPAPAQGVDPERKLTLGLGAEPRVSALASVGLVVEGENPRHHTISAGALRPEELLFEGVAPGRRTAFAYADHGYVAAITSGTTDLRNNSLVIPPSGSVPPIEVTLRDDAATVEGTVTTSAPLTGAGIVFFLPLDPSAQFDATILSPSGTFTDEKLVPGTYRVIALRKPATMPPPYREPATLDHYSSLGPLITALPNQHLTPTLPLIDEQEPQP